MGGKYVCAEVRRREDPRLLRGRGQFVDDLPVADCLHAVVVRSPHAHAQIRAVHADMVHPTRVRELIWQVKG